MARMKIETTHSIYDLIPQYGAHKEELDAIKKVCDQENKDIKALMSQDNQTEVEAGGYVAKYIVQKRESLNEDTLIALFTSVPGFVKIAEECGIIKTKSYIDFDALESAMYNDKVPEELVLEMDKAKEVKEVATLRVSKAKKKEDDE